MLTERLNFHHLHYFWAVAKNGNLTHTARELGVAQSALSAQIKQLERQLDERLFSREGRRLVLTEAGQIALEYAEQIFASGAELVSTFEDGRRRDDAYRIGAVATLSRNFQESFVLPLLSQRRLRLELRSGRLGELLERLGDHRLDVVLSNRSPVPRSEWGCRRIARQQVSVVGRPRSKRLRFPRDLQGERLVLPGPASDVRSDFDAICAQHELEVEVMAEVDDMATLRLVARDGDALAVLPSVVVRDELHAGTLRELCVIPGLFENFYAITAPRRFPHPLTAALLARQEQEFLDMEREWGTPGRLTRLVPRRLLREDDEPEEPDPAGEGAPEE